MGGNADTVNNHTVKSDVPVDAKFTDTVYDDTKIKEDIKNLSDNVSVIDVENLIPFPYAQQERTTNGVTFTFEKDGSIIANGTATADADFSVCVRTDIGTDKALMLEPGTYAITGCPEGGSDSTYRVHVQFGDKDSVKYNLRADYGEGFIFEVTEEYAKYACQIQCHVKSGYTVSNLVFKPMLVRGSILKKYQPYKLSRKSLRYDIGKQNENLSVIGKCKNLFNSILKTNSLYGVNCTNNGDGTYTLNGTSTKDRWISFGNITLKPGKYKFIATKNNVEVNNLSISLNGIAIAKSGEIFTIQSKGVCDIGLSTYKKTFDNVIIKPMITTNFSATYDDFVPYTGDGETLASDVAEIKKDLGDLTFSASGKTLTITDGTNTWTLEANK